MNDDIRAVIIGVVAGLVIGVGTGAVGVLAALLLR